MEIKDLSGISKPLEKLISSVSSGIGILYEPTRIKRKAQAEAYSQIIQANTELQKIELVQRATQRISFQELRAQQNIDNIVAEAYKNIPNEVDDDPVDPDWVSRFFDDCRSISDAQLQEVWGKILADEVSKPGQYSRITLSTLKNVSKKDAILFEKVASLAWKIIGGIQSEIFPFIPVEFDRIPMPLDFCGITHDDCIHLSNLGLINVSKDLFLQVVDGSNAYYFDNAYMVYLSLSDLPANAGNLNIFSFSQAGLELFPLLRLEYNSKWEVYSLERMTRILNAEFEII